MSITATSKMPEVEARRKEEAVPWTEDIKFKSGRLVIEHASYNRWVREFMGSLGLDLTPITDADYRKSVHENGVKVGNGWFYLRPLKPFVWKSVWSGFLFPDPKSYRWMPHSLGIYRRARELGWALWDGEVSIPILTTSMISEPWMSLTPSEILSQRAGVKKARGNVLIGGLGMGWFARRVLERKQVNRVVIVDKSPDIIQMFGEPLRRDFGHRVELVEGDAFEYARHRVPQFDSILFDVWEGYGHARDDYKWQSIKSTAQMAGKSVWDWD